VLCRQFVTLVCRLSVAGACIQLQTWQKYGTRGRWRRRVSYERYILNTISKVKKVKVTHRVIAAGRRQQWFAWNKFEFGVNSGVKLGVISFSSEWVNSNSIAGGYAGCTHRHAAHIILTAATASSVMVIVSQMSNEYVARPGCLTWDEPMFTCLSTIRHHCSGLYVTQWRHKWRGFSRSAFTRSIFQRSRAMPECENSFWYFYSCTLRTDIEAKAVCVSYKHC